MNLNEAAIMAYQTVNARKRYQKAVHLLFHFIALVISVLGTYAVFKFHNEIGLYDMFTLHSWLGIITICAFGLQVILCFNNTEINFQCVLLLKIIVIFFSTVAVWLFHLLVPRCREVNKSHTETMA